MFTGATKNLEQTFLRIKLWKSAIFQSYMNHKENAFNPSD